MAVVAGRGGAVVFMVEALAPEYTRHAPVVIEQWNHLRLGAKACANHTGEIPAMAEAMLWLMDEAPDDGSAPDLNKYDSM